jgi:hypothetical protein
MANTDTNTSLKEKIFNIFGEEGIKTDITFKPAPDVYLNLIGIGLIILIIYNILDSLIFKKLF